MVNELRIGNLLLVDDNNWTVDTISSDELYFKENIEYNHILNAKPIPLTEQWLLKFGFEICNHTATYGILRIQKGSFDKLHVWQYTIVLDIDSYFYIDIKHVHQLQNLYFALTGEELKSQP